MANKQRTQHSLTNILARTLNIDIFGETKGFEIQGQSHFPSVLGALMTLLITMFVLMYTSEKMQVMFGKDDNSFQQVVKRLSIDRTRNYT